MTIEERALSLTAEEKKQVRDYEELAYQGDKDAQKALSGLFGIEIKNLGQIYQIGSAVFKSMSGSQQESEYDHLRQLEGSHSIVQLNKNKVINKIACYRMAKGLTQTELAKKIGVTQKDVSRWETGVRVPKVEVLKKIADVLGCKIDDLA